MLNADLILSRSSVRYSQSDEPSMISFSGFKFLIILATNEFDAMNQRRTQAVHKSVDQNRIKMRTKKRFSGA